MEGTTLEGRDFEKIRKAMPESGGYTYRKILQVDLEHDRCKVLKSDPEGWQPDDGPLSAQTEQFARGGAIHPDDVERFVAFTRPDQLRRKPRQGQDTLDLIYRRKVEGGYRWNLMEVIPDRADQARYAILCVKDVHDVLQEGFERDGLGARSRELLHSLEDREYIISSLSTLFFSTYYVDLGQDSFRAVTQLHRVGDVLGNEVNCTAALQLYANHFVHPEDRGEYLSVMNIQNLRNSLRWWQPYVAVEYRKLPEDPAAGLDKCSWVRATAVLARAGEGDLPQTAVYVAQDMGVGRHRADNPIPRGVGKGSGRTHG